MAFDGFVVRALVNELSAKLTQARLDKIQQPLPKDLLLTFRAAGQTYKLLLSANPSFPRAYLEPAGLPDNPTEPPTFCMLLRKQLEGARLSEIRQIGNDRILHFTFETRSELGDIQERVLIYELMGKHSNLIVMDPQNGRIFDSIVHVNRATSSYREILPGRTYAAPPSQNKQNPFTADFHAIWEDRKRDTSLPFPKFLLQTFEGMSPILAKEISWLADQSSLQNRLDAEQEAFYNFLAPLQEHRYQPTLIRDTAEKLIGFSIIPLSHLKGIPEACPSVSDMLHRFYTSKAEQSVVNQKAGDLERFLKTEISKNEQKLIKFHDAKKEAAQAETWRIYGELLTAHLHELERGMQTVQLTNYYSDSQEKVDIPLDPDLTPIENAQQYFKRYNKFKKSIPVIEEQEQIARQEIDYLEGILVQLASATWQDIDQIRDELTSEGYLKRSRGKRILESEKPTKKRPKPHVKESHPQPSKFVSSEGCEIWVGKNNRQNDALTFKLSNSNDTWLHTKEIPGSHVLIRGRDFTDITLKEAAELAAYFSKARDSSNVPVDYTSVKNVWKPNGAKPGFVLYEKARTLYVTPKTPKLLQNDGKR